MKQQLLIQAMSYKAKNTTIWVLRAGTKRSKLTC